jgi:alpha-D-ribose 1-methylphosphonate 5-triphosphate synthase subunit PhnG
MSQTHDWTQGEYLSVLTHTPAAAVKALAEDIIPHLGQITVLKCRTGLVMLPYSDSVRGTLFHLGEVLVSEAHVRLETSGVEGYSMCAGRDLQQAMAVALLDAALQVNAQRDAILAFVSEQAEQQRAADDALLREVETTRVQMETF